MNVITCLLCISVPLDRDEDTSSAVLPWELVKDKAWFCKPKAVCFQDSGSFTPLGCRHLLSVFISLNLEIIIK